MTNAEIVIITMSDVIADGEKEAATIQGLYHLMKIKLRPYRLYRAQMKKFHCDEDHLRGR